MTGVKRLLRSLLASDCRIGTGAQLSRTMPRLAPCACALLATPSLAVAGPTHSVFGNSRTMSSAAKAPRPDFVAFESRVGLSLPSEVVGQALPRRSQMESKLSEHERFRVLGSHFIRFVVSRHLFSKYPELAASVLETAIEGYAGSAAIGSVGRTIGVEKIIDWAPLRAQDRLAENVIIAQTVYAIVGAVLATQGTQEALQFVQRHILSRSLDFTSHMRLAEPKRVLAALLKKKGMEAPVARLLEESGRMTHAPSFVVGIFSGATKLGEGVGNSLKMAETRAARAALRANYLKEVAAGGVLEQDLEGLSEESLSFVKN